MDSGKIVSDEVMAITIALNLPSIHFREKQLKKARIGTEFAKSHLIWFSEKNEQS